MSDIPNVPNSLINLNGNMLCAVDVETSGLLAGYHEILQIAVQPLTSNIQPTPDILPFYMEIAPQYPERVDKGASSVHGLDIDYLINNCPDQWKSADLFDEYFQNLNLPFRKRLVPLAHNYPFERGFLIHWLGLETFNQIFYIHPRDTMGFAIGINDAASFHNKKVPFPYVGLGSMCNKFGIEMEKAHDALCDARAEAELYRRMLLAFGS